ncbi:hypothetical protein L0F63_000124 [Massospora cicadina]|nr:hypothetical protein L0F63_000124 [Massospora cicadina]
MSNERILASMGKTIAAEKNVVSKLQQLIQGDSPITHASLVLKLTGDIEPLASTATWCAEYYEKHSSDLSVRYIVWVLEASMKKLVKENLYVLFILTFNNKEIERGNIDNATLINQLIKMEFDPIDDKDDDGSINNGLSTSCSNNKGWRVALKPKLKRESKESKLKVLTCSESASKPAAPNWEPTSGPASLPLQQHFKAQNQIYYRMIVTTMMTSSGAASAKEREEAECHEVYYQVNGKTLIWISWNQAQSRPKCKNIKVSNNEEDFEEEVTLPTIS